MSVFMYLLSLVLHLLTAVVTESWHVFLMLLLLSAFLKKINSLFPESMIENDERKRTWKITVKQRYIYHYCMLVMAKCRYYYAKYRQGFVSLYGCQPSKRGKLHMYAQLSKVYNLLQSHGILTWFIYTYICINRVGNTEFDVFLNVLHKT